MVERVLLIEDTISSRSALFEYLSAVSEVIRARSVLEAIAQCARLDPEVIIADCPIDGEDGLAVLQEMRRSDCARPLIVVSHVKSENEVLALMKAGAFAHLTKPVSEAEVVAAMWRAAEA